jgi:hypothetical protein
MFRRKGYKHNHPVNNHEGHAHAHHVGHGAPKDGMSKQELPGGVRLGVILNGVVVETIQANNQYASMFLAQPSFVDITDLPEVVVGSEYGLN